MKFIAVFFFIVILASSQALFGISRNRRRERGRDPFDTNPHRLGPKLVDQWITQKLDNFDPKNEETWEMRFIENDMYFKAGGPIFIFIGGEWTISEGSIREGNHITDMAKEMDGLLFYTEHRYYGQSWPTQNTTTENLQWLSIDQSLADLAHFINQMKETRPELKDAKVFVVGGSYSATMAAWMRQKYPHVVDGAWASSAPLHAKVNFVEYKEVMGRSIRLLGGDECYNRFSDAYAEMEAMVLRGNVDRINEELNLCEPLDVNNKMNVWSLFGELSDDVAGLVQTHRGQNIQNACKFLLEERHEDAFGAYAAWTKSHSFGCFEYDYEDIVEEFKEVDWSAPANGAMRQWIYQTCSEFGWYQTSDSPNQPFGSSFPVELYYEMCKDFYGIEFSKPRIDANVRRVNLVYGSFNPTATQVYYTHGEIDPWSAMGVQKNVSATAPANVIPLISHCGDLGSITSTEAAEVRQSKEFVTELAKEWLKV